MTFPSNDIINELKHQIDILHPEYLSIRNYWEQGCTVFQSAVLSGDTSMIWMVIDVYRKHEVVTNNIHLLFERDFIGRSCVHYIADMPHPNSILDSILAHLDGYQPTHRSTMLPSRVKSLSIRSSIYSNSIRRISSISKLFSALENDDDDDDNDHDHGIDSSSSNGKDGSHIIIKEGWLTKKRTFGVFNRWVVLTADRFMYYSSKSASTMKEKKNRPLFVASVADCTFEQGMNGLQPTLIVRSSLIKTRRRSMGRLSSKSGSGSSCDTMVFTTAEGSSSSSSHDIQGWMEVLQGLSDIRLLSKMRSIPMNYINVDLRRLWVNMIDHNSDTALHVLVKRDVLASSSSRSDSSCTLSISNTSHAIKFAYWLIENGCPVNATNKLGMTAMHLCVIMFFYYASSSIPSSSSSSTVSWFDYHRSLILCLLNRGGADVMNIRNNHGLSVLDLLRDDLPYLNNESVLNYGIELEELLSNGGGDDTKQSSNRSEGWASSTSSNIAGGGNVKMLGYSYLSFYFKEG